MCVCVCVQTFLCIYIYYHQQTDSFVISQPFIGTRYAK